MLNGAVNASRYGNHQHEHRRSHRQYHRSWQAFHKLLHHRLFNHIGKAKIALYGTPQPVQILENKRFIQPQLMAQRVNFLLADDNILVAGNHLAHRVTRRQHNQRKGYKADAQKHNHYLRYAA